MMGMGRYYVTQHALERVRLRWTGAGALTDGELVRTIVYAIESAERQKKLVRTPGGTYAPFSLQGKSGYLVVKRNRVVTALGDEYCPEVREVIEGR